MNTRPPAGFDRRYNDGLDAEVARGRGPAAAAPRRRPALDADTALPPAPPPPRRLPSLLDVQLMSVPLFAGFVFGICGALAAGSVEFMLRRFAEEAGVSRAIFVVVPALFAMMFAIVVYQRARLRISSVAQSISRAILVVLLTWAAFSALATWTWCLPENYGSCYGNFLLASGIIGGGPMLLAALVSGALVGWLIRQQRLGWLME